VVQQSANPNRTSKSVWNGTHIEPQASATFSQGKKGAIRPSVLLPDRNPVPPNSLLYPIHRRWRRNSSCSRWDSPWSDLSLSSPPSPARSPRFPLHTGKSGKLGTHPNPSQGPSYRRGWGERVYAPDSSPTPTLSLPLPY
jgi:hypothetical protein